VERVSLIHGKEPVVFVCPYGGDFPNLCTVAEFCALVTGSSAIINRGFLKSEAPDFLAELGDCDNLKHLMSDPVIHAEYYRPFLRMVQRKVSSLRSFRPVLIFHILPFQGGGNNSVVLGIGEGRSGSYSCETYYSSEFRHEFQRKPKYQGQPDGGAVEAIADGDCSGSNPYCVNQLFRRYHNDDGVQSMQVYLSPEWFCSETHAILAGQFFGEIVEVIMKEDDIDLGALKSI
jgi:hypothetical protein